MMSQEETTTQFETSSTANQNQASACVSYKYLLKYNEKKDAVALSKNPKS